MAEVIRFEAQLVRGFRSWMGVEVPERVTERLGTRGLVPVEGSVNGFAFRGSLAPTRQGHFMWLKKAIREECGVQPGQTVQVVLRPVRERPSLNVPAELETALAASPEASRWWDALSASKHRIATIWISQAKSSEVRAYRVSDVLRRARRAYLNEGPFYPTKEDQPRLNRPKEMQHRPRLSS
jgi:Domain of unknown function (DUF1905)/Bacteriocin-protection, YdeI or OmpD-Associated